NGYENAALLFCNRCYRFYVDDVHQRIRWRFHPQEPGLLIEKRSDIFNVCEINEMEDYPKLFKNMLEHAVGSAVEVVAGDNLVPRFQQFDHRVGGSHARREA